MRTGRVGALLLPQDFGQHAGGVGVVGCVLQQIIQLGGRQRQLAAADLDDLREA